VAHSVASGTQLPAEHSEFPNCAHCSFDVHLLEMHVFAPPQRVPGNAPHSVSVMQLGVTHTFSAVQ
jgi:hypothetical protein